MIVFFFNDTATTEIYTLSLHDALPISGGASNRAEFENNAACLVRREELESELFTARAELETVCRTEPELAISEEDMLDFELADNATQLQQIEESLEQSAGELQAAFERLGSVKRELTDLESVRQIGRASCRERV